MLRAYLILASLFFLTGCGNSTLNAARLASQLENSATLPSSVHLYATNTTLHPGDSTKLYAAGGSAPYTYSIYSGDGILSGNTYTAGTATGKIVTLQVTDSSGSVASAKISIESSLTFSLSSSTVSIGGTVQLIGKGGLPPYTFALTSGSGSIEDQLYQAPAFGTTATIQMTDQKGDSAQASITVQYQAPLQITPSSTTLYTQDSLTFEVTGGSGSYQYALISGNGTLSEATYTAPATPTTAQIQIWDSEGRSTVASIQVVKKALLYITSGFSLDHNALLVFQMPNRPNFLPSFAIGGAGSNGDFGRGVNRKKNQETLHFAPAPASTAITLSNFNLNDNSPYTGTLIISARNAIHVYGFCAQSGDPNGHLKKINTPSPISTSYSNISFGSFAPQASGGINLQGLWLSALDTADGVGHASIQIQAGAHQHQLTDCSNYSDLALISTAQP